MNNRISLFVPINKFDDELRMVYGIATNAGLDKQNEVVDYSATKDALKDYSQWRNIREMHKPSAVGTAPILELRDATEELFIGAKIVDDQAWAKCKEGVYKGFSIGGEVLDRRVEINKATGRPINRVTKYVMNEISVVDRPANPTCKFQTVKRDTSIETITLSDDPLKDESMRVMEKAIMLSKRILTKSELEALPDEKFGLIKVISDGDSLIKHRLYPMPDRTHAINMVRKMVSCDELSEQDKERIHTTALSVLGKKHNESECPYCVKSKLEGGAKVNKKIVKAAVVVPEDPKKKTAEEVVQEPAEEQKPNIIIDEEAPASDAVPAGQSTDAKLDRVISLLETLIGVEGAEGEEPMDDSAGGDDEPITTEDEITDVVEDEELVTEQVEEKAPEDEIEEQPMGEQEEVVEPATSANTISRKKTIVEECYKGLKARKRPVLKGSMLAKVRAIVEPIAKENRELRKRLDKIEKAPLARKGTFGDKVEKIEKYPTSKVQDVRLTKLDVIYSDELQKDIEKANDLRKGSKALTQDERAFCERVADKMLEEKFSKVS